MKKVHRFLFITVLAFSLSCDAHAIENPYFSITNSNIRKAVYYDVSDETVLQSAEGSVFVARQVTYEGKVTPDKLMCWRESIGGITCQGTLKLSQFVYKDNKTYATYWGILVAKE